MKIALFGGTFNPPHIGHIRLANAVVEELAPDKLILMPAGIPPHKVLPAGSATSEERYEMTLLMARDIPGAEVSRLELEREGASYTSDTLRALKAEYPACDLILTVGGDMFLTLDRWHESEVIFSLASVAAAPRDFDEREEMLLCAGRYQENFGARVTILQNPVVEISSSEIREAIRKGDAPRLLSGDVADYIRKKGLYR